MFEIILGLALIIFSGGYIPIWGTGSIALIVGICRLAARKIVKSKQEMISIGKNATSSQREPRRPATILQETGWA